MTDAKRHAPADGWAVADTDEKMIRGHLKGLRERNCGWLADALERNLRHPLPASAPTQSRKFNLGEPAQGEPRS